MKVLLIFPPNVNVIEPFKSMKVVPSRLALGFPLGIGYLAAVLEQNKIDVSLFDCSYVDVPMNSIKNKIKEYQPDVVGICMYTQIAKTAVKVAEIAKEVDKKITVVVGGPHATYEYTHLLRDYPIDFIVLGEGELTFLELLKSLQSNEKNFHAIKVVSFLEENKIVITDKRPLIENLDTLPYPARHFVDFNNYIRSDILPNVVTILSSRGCSHRCAFCSSGHFFGRWRPRSPENVIEEMKYLKREYNKIQSFAFFDDNFTYSKERVIRFCDLNIKNRLNKYMWTCLARVDQVDLEMLKMMRKAGCEKISYGIESGSVEILKNIHKAISFEQAKKAIEWTNEAKIKSLAFFMLGNPGETMGTINKSVRFAKSLGAKSTLWIITQVYPGTELAIKSPPINFTEYVYEPEINNPQPLLHPCIPVFENPGLNRKKLINIQKTLLKKFLIYHAIRNTVVYFKYFITSPLNAIRYVFMLLKCSAK
jgi:radical SAM superfamily enzyme YgiQ (UPF0313 family)